jgi:hypothetical protein
MINSILRRTELSRLRSNDPLSSLMNTMNDWQLRRASPLHKLIVDAYLTRVAGVYASIRQALSVPERHVVHGGLLPGERKYSYRLVPPRNPLSVRWV